MYKSDLKRGGHRAIFLVLEINRSKILQRINESDCFCLNSLLHFYGVSRGKTDLHNKYMI